MITFLKIIITVLLLGFEGWLQFHEGRTIGKKQLTKSEEQYLLIHQFIVFFGGIYLVGEIWF